jgi:hypothetical protein
MWNNEEGYVATALDLILWPSDAAAHPSVSLEIQVPSWWTPRITLVSLRLALKSIRGVGTAHRVKKNLEWMLVPFCYRERCLLSVLPCSDLTNRSAS